MGSVSVHVGVAQGRVPVEPPKVTVSKLSARVTTVGAGRVTEVETQVRPAGRGSVTAALVTVPDDWFVTTTV